MCQNLLDVSKTSERISGRSSVIEGRKISRRKLLGGGAAVPAGVGLDSLLQRGEGATALAGSNGPGANGVGGKMGHAGHESFAHATFAPGRSVDHRANGFDPSELLRDFDYGKTRRPASGRGPRGGGVVGPGKGSERGAGGE